MATFHNLNLRFTTPDAFRAWLHSQPRPTWGARGATYHNTYRPNEASWLGRASMKSMQATYEAKGWDRGPHLYLAAGTTSDGVFVMTPPWLEGIHAGDCNNDRFGIEVVGDFQSKPMSPAQLDLLVESAAILHHWAALDPDINAHRDCMVRTCPGDAAYAQKPEIQARLAAELDGYTEDSLIMGFADTRGVASAILTRPTGEYSEKDIRLVIVPAYEKTCAAVGVNPVLAIAQCLHETGNLASFWASRPQRNPAGIGVNGQVRYNQPATPGWAFNPQRNRWEMGVSFKEWAGESVPAHVGRLLAYVLPSGSGTPAQRDLIKYALGFRGLPASVRGSAQTLKALGKDHNPSGQGWASPGTYYGAAIAATANRLVST